MTLAVLTVLAPGPLAAQTPASLVRVDPVVRETVSQTVPVIGRMVAERRGVIAARIAAPVAGFEVQVGDHVEPGQVIVRLDDATLTARRDLAAARLEEAQARIAVREAQRALANKEFRRMAGLRSSAAFNQARYDDTQQQVAIAQAEVAEARAAVTSARAELELAAINLRDAEVQAPFAGVITERLTEAGAYVVSGAPVARLIGDQSLEVEADVSFQYLAGLEPGTEVGLVLDDGAEHTAITRAIVPSENPLTRTRTVRFVPNIASSQRVLAHGQSVTLHIPTAPRAIALSVHKDAVIKRRGDDVVFVVEGDTARAQVVELGPAIGGRFEVRSGLKEGDQVVVRGNERLKTGDKVQISEGSS